MTHAPTSLSTKSGQGHGAVTAAFAYDGVGRRITRTISSTTEKYAYDGLDIIQQLNNAGTVGANYFRSLAIDEPWQRIDVGSANTNLVYLADALGSAVALADTNKLIQTSYVYDPFGNTTTMGMGSKNGYQFSGRENDGTGLYYYRARYYQPALGRFVSEDPLGMFDGPDPYVFVKNSPLLWIDPSGLSGYRCYAPKLPLPPPHSPLPDPSMFPTRAACVAACDDWWRARTRQIRDWAQSEHEKYNPPGGWFGNPWNPWGTPGAGGGNRDIFNEDGPLGDFIPCLVETDRRIDAAKDGFLGVADRLKVTCTDRCKNQCPERQ